MCQFILSDKSSVLSGGAAFQPSCTLGNDAPHHLGRTKIHLWEERRKTLSVVGLWSHIKLIIFCYTEYLIMFWKSQKYLFRVTIVGFLLWILLLLYMTNLYWSHANKPVATLLQLWAALGLGTSPYDWPPVGLLPWSRGCPSWRTQRSGSQEVTLTTCPAVQSRERLKKKKKEKKKVRIYAELWIIIKPSNVDVDVTHMTSHLVIFNS